MTEKGYMVLSSLLNTNKGTFINYVVIGRDNNLDNDYSNEIEELCVKHSLNYTYRTSNIVYQKSDYYLSISWRWLLNVENLIVLHDSILPKYRGFAPLVNALINGEKEVGVTAIFASKEYDKGNVILQKKTPIYYPIKINSVITKVGKIYSEIVLELFDLIALGKNITSSIQNEDEATYSLWLDEDDYFINWSENSDKIMRKVDACGSPYSGAKATLLGKTIIIKNVELIPDLVIENRAVGKLIFYQNEFPVIVCGKGLIKIKECIYADTLQSVFPLKKFRLRFS